MRHHILPTIIKTVQSILHKEEQHLTVPEFQRITEQLLLAHYDTTPNKNLVDADCTGRYIKMGLHPYQVVSQIAQYENLCRIDTSHKIPLTMHDEENAIYCLSATKALQIS
jgi:hypothetical protein